MLLWLDATRPAPSDDWEWVKTASEAIDALAGGYFDEVSLNHDLGSDPDAGTGLQVAEWIERAAHAGRIGRLRWRVHSSSTPGREKTVKALQTADRHWSEAL